jgi:hypothetical protein
MCIRIFIYIQSYIRVYVFRQLCFDISITTISSHVVNLSIIANTHVVAYGTHVRVLTDLEYKSG